MARADFLEILRVLVRHEVEFVTVGGLAAVFAGVPIATVDVDIVHRRTPENVSRLLSALEELQAVHRNDPRRLRPGESHLSGPGHQLLRTRFGDLDVLGSIEEATTYEDVLGEAIEVQLDDIRVLALGLKRLIRSKEAVGRPKDLAMLPVLRATLVERGDDLGEVE